MLILAGVLMLLIPQIFSHTGRRGKEPLRHSLDYDQIINETVMYPVDRMKAPYMFMVQILKTPKCTGTLISLRWVLTAGWCLTNRNPLEFNIVPYYTVSVLPYSVNRDMSDAEFHAKAVFIHEDYNEDTRKHDIGLIKVSLTYYTSGLVNTVSLSKALFYSEEGLGTECSCRTYTNYTPNTDDLSTFYDYNVIAQVKNMRYREFTPATPSSGKSSVSIIPDEDVDYKDVAGRIKRFVSNYVFKSNYTVLHSPYHAMLFEIKNLTPIPPRECNAPKEFIFENHICTKEAPGNVLGIPCSMMTGSPLLCGFSQQVGILSWNMGCVGLVANHDYINQSAVFTRVGAYKTWITNIIIGASYEKTVMSVATKVSIIQNFIFIGFGFVRIYF